jgi:hypothetical protein
VLDGSGAAEHVQMRREMLQRNMMPIRQEAHQRLLARRPIRNQATNLDTITSRDDEAFVDVLPQRQQRRAHRLRSKGQLLAHHNRAGTLVGSDYSKLHVG